MESDVFSPEKANGFEEYFGAHPQLVEGARYFGNSEVANYSSTVTLTTNDLTTH